MQLKGCLFCVYSNKITFRWKNGSFDHRGQKHRYKLQNRIKNMCLRQVISKGWSILFSSSTMQTLKSFGTRTGWSSRVLQISFKRLQLVRSDSHHHCNDITSDCNVRAFWKNVWHFLTRPKVKSICIRT